MNGNKGGYDPEYLPITMLEPWHAHLRPLIDWLWTMLSVLGFAATCALAGLYYAGFFHWLATFYPDAAVLQFLFGGRK